LQKKFERENTLEASFELSAEIKERLFADNVFASLAEYFKQPASALLAYT
jgi:hypothetical protein